MTAKLLRQLGSSFVLAILLNILYWSIAQGSSTGEARQLDFLALFLSIGSCVILGLLSLSALINLRPKVASNEVLSLFSFIGPSFLLFLFLLVTFFFGANSDDSLKEFLEIGFAPLVYGLILVGQYFRFRNWYERQASS